MSSSQEGGHVDRYTTIMVVGKMNLDSQHCRQPRCRSDADTNDTFVELLSEFVLIKYRAILCISLPHSSVVYSRILFRMKKNYQRCSVELDDGLGISALFSSPPLDGLD
uniref:Uncharacterized protein n=1 Tax=Compsopogon caeruleus TaxID=31354 RepID=A0A7S1TDK3_9RHOD|mmetsp:Transcript_2325/g.3998  ORF Transcript_2325/g.3998 Transcript_2325/m.3998 type:complete len:109 (+) Transcript_2325:635-961(+)